MRMMKEYRCPLKPIPGLCRALVTGNMHMLELIANEDQRRQYLEPMLAGVPDAVRKSTSARLTVYFLPLWQARCVRASR